MYSGGPSTKFICLQTSSKVSLSNSSNNLLFISCRNERTKPWDAKMVQDPVQDRLFEIIEAKKKGRKRPTKVKEEKPASDNVVSIMDALKSSIAADKRR